MTFKELIATKATELKHGVAALLLTGIAERVSSFLLKRTERIAANSTRELIAWGFKRLFKKEKIMEQAEQKIGSVGAADESYAAGVAKVQASVALPATAFGLTVGVQVTGSLDAKVLVAYLAAKIGGPIPAEVAAFIESALAAS